jgi:MFS family permease
MSRTPNPPMLRALAHRTYRRLFLAQVASLAATGLITVALALLAYDLAGGQAGQVLGTAFAVKMVAYVLVAPFASALVAHLPRRAVMVGADAVRILAVLCLPFIGEIWHVYVLIFLLQCASATFTPTFQSVIPQVLEDEEDYTAALSLSRLAYDLESVLSPALAALLLLFMPSNALFFWTALGFAGSALLVLTVPVPPVPRESDGEVTPFLRRVRRGASLFVSTRALRPLLVLNLAVASAGAFVLVQTVVIAKTVYGQGDDMVALLLAANGLGSMTAAFLLPRLLRRHGDRRIMLGGAVLLAVATAGIPLALAGSAAGGLAAVAVLWVAVGWAWSSVETPVGRIIRRHVPAADLPAAFAAQFSLSHACWLITYPVAGWLGSVSLPLTALVLAGVAAASTLAAAVLWPRVPDVVEVDG